MAAYGATLRRIKRVTNSPKHPMLDTRLASQEAVFKSPPMTQELAKAIRLISPHLDFQPNEASRTFWEREQNGACWAEWECLVETFSKLPKPIRILEIGPGSGARWYFSARN